MTILVRCAAAAMAAAALLTGGAANAVTVIDTTPSWNGTNLVGNFGEPTTATYGQTFVVPATDTRLDSFTFYVDDTFGPEVDFQAFVMAWDGAKATGPVLFQSAALSTTNNGGSGGFEQFTINTGGLVLAANAPYVAFFSTSTVFDGAQDGSNWGRVNDTYAGGQFVVQNNTSDFAALTTVGWFLGGRSFGDLAFKMTFNSAQSTSSVPEPATLGLLGAGLAGMGLLVRRRKAA